MKGGWVYILANRPNGTLYVGVTSDLQRRIWEHREGVVDGFTKRHGLKMLAIQRERRMKHRPRSFKVSLVLAANADWRDLYDTLA